MGIWKMEHFHRHPLSACCDLVLFFFFFLYPGLLSTGLSPCGTVCKLHVCRVEVYNPLTSVGRGGSRFWSGGRILLGVSPHLPCTETLFSARTCFPLLPFVGLFVFVGRVQKWSAASSCGRSQVRSCLPLGTVGNFVSRSAVRLSIRIMPVGYDGD